MHEIYTHLSRVHQVKRSGYLESKTTNEVFLCVHQYRPEHSTKNLISRQDAVDWFGGFAVHESEKFADDAGFDIALEELLPTRSE